MRVRTFQELSLSKEYVSSLRLHTRGMAIYLLFKDGREAQPC
jgi:hypothetical protein